MEKAKRNSPGTCPTTGSLQYLDALGQRSCMIFQSALYPKATNFCVRFIYANYASQVQVAKIFIEPYITMHKMLERISKYHKFIKKPVLMNSYKFVKHTNISPCGNSRTTAKIQANQLRGHPKIIHGQSQW